MKGTGWIVVLLGLLGVVYLLGRDLHAVTGERAGKVVVEPLQKAKDAANLANEAQRSLDEKLKGIER